MSIACCLPLVELGCFQLFFFDGSKASNRTLRFISGLVTSSEVSILRGFYFGGLDVPSRGTPMRREDLCSLSPAIVFEAPVLSLGFGSRVYRV